MLRLIFIVSIFGLIIAGCFNAGSADDDSTDSSSDSDSDTDTDSDSDTDTESDSDSDSSLGCDPEIEYIFCDDFESYEAGDYIAQTAGDPWFTWSDPPLPGEDAQVSDEQAWSGTNSLYIIAENDVVVDFGLSSGKYRLELHLFVEDGRVGHIMLAQEFTGGGWGTNLFFLPGSKAYFQVWEWSPGGGDTIEEIIFKYNQGEWFYVEVILDLDEALASIVVGDDFTHSWPWAGVSNLGSLDFYGIPDEPGSGFYVDDIKMTEL